FIAVVVRWSAAVALLDERLALLGCLCLRRIDSWQLFGKLVPVLEVGAGLRHAVRRSAARPGTTGGTAGSSAALRGVGLRATARSKRNRGDSDEYGAGVDTVLWRLRHELLGG